MECFPVHIILLYLSSIFMWLHSYGFRHVFEMLDQQSSIRLSQHPSIELVAKFKWSSATLNLRMLNSTMNTHVGLELYHRSLS